MEESQHVVRLAHDGDTIVVAGAPLGRCYRTAPIIMPDFRNSLKRRRKSGIPEPQEDEAEDSYRCIMRALLSEAQLTSSPSELSSYTQLKVTQTPTAYSACRAALWHL